MSTYSFAAGLGLVSDLPLTAPPPAKTRLPVSEVEIELQAVPHHYQLRSIDRPCSNTISPESQGTPFETGSPHDAGATTPTTPNELEARTARGSTSRDAVNIVPSWSYPAMNKWRILCACLTYLGNGMNDSAPGALIPYMEKDYHIGYAIVSLIFVTNAVGFIATAFAADAVRSKLGRAKTLMLSEVIMTLGYVIIVCTPPFAAIIVAYLFLGLGYALNLAMNNVFCANLSNATVMLGAAHGSYGIGGVIGPILATAMASHGIPWSRFYLITIGVRVVCFFFAGWAFKGYESEPTSQFSSSLERLASRQHATETGQQSKTSLLMRALRNRTTIIGAIFVFAYQGAEVSISGWVISYLIQDRGGVPSKVGYVTAGFWGGITVGRFVLTHFAHRIGEKPSVWLFTFGALVFQLLVWFIPNVIGDAIAVSILGLLLGPVYPCSQTIFSQLLPSSIQMSSISFISSAGSSGGAVAPLLTGIIAQAVGTFVLHPICIALFAVMMGCWLALPKVVKRTE